MVHWSATQASSGYVQGVIQDIVPDGRCFLAAWEVSTPVIALKHERPKLSLPKQKVRFRSVMLSSSAASQPQMIHELIRNGFTTHLSTNQVNLAYLCKKKINCWRLQMTASLKLRLKQQLCRCSGLKSRRDTEITTTALKILLSFPTYYLVEAKFSAVTATKTNNGVNWTYATHFGSH